jgi:N utilization substance protein B
VDALDRTLATRRVSIRRQPYLRLLLEILDRELPSVDDALGSCLENWTLERLSRLDRSILRLAATEILFIDDVPAPVSIQEAIRLAEHYSGEESARFVNGVLDALYRRGRSHP